MNWYNYKEYAPPGNNNNEYIFKVKILASGIVTNVHVTYLRGDIKDWHICYNENKTVKDAIGEYEILKWCAIER